MQSIASGVITHEGLIHPSDNVYAPPYISLKVIRIISLMIAGLEQPLNITFLIYNFPSKLDVCNTHFIPKLLQGTPADYKPFRHLLVRQKMFTSQYRTIFPLHLFHFRKDVFCIVYEIGNPFAFPCHQSVILRHSVL